MSLSPLTCRWVPGTLDRVLVSSPLGHGEVSLRDVRRVLGPGAVHDLYLRGRHRRQGHADHIWYALVCLGCPVGPDDPASVPAAQTPERPPDLAATRPAPPPLAPAGPGTPLTAGGPV